MLEVNAQLTISSLSSVQVVSETQDTIHYGLRSSLRSSRCHNVMVFFRRSFLMLRNVGVTTT